MINLWHQRFSNRKKKQPTSAKILWTTFSEKIIQAHKEENVFHWKKKWNICKTFITEERTHQINVYGYLSVLAHQPTVKNKNSEII